MKPNDRLAKANLLLLLGASVWASPVTTVPWNGHKGAVTFTFDDGCPTQLTNVLPALKARGQTATFFLIGNSAFTGKQAEWKAAALAGHELGNHTTLHDQLNSLDSAKITAEIRDQALALRAVDPAVEAVTLAYPYCGTNDLVNRIANRENIIARTCGGDGLFAWNSKPTEWMSMTSFILQDDASVPAALTQIDKAAADNSWLVTLNHGIGGDWNYIGTAQAISMFDRAVAAKVWVSTYQNVAAYWRASKTMDTVTARQTSTGWDLAWTSPHPRMPRSVRLRIKLDTATFGSTAQLSQNGTPIARESDGSYVIDFMKLALSVSRTSSRSPRNHQETRPSIVRTSNHGDLRIDGIDDGLYSCAFVKADGSRSAEAIVLARGRSATIATADITGRTSMLELRSSANPADHWLFRLPSVR